MRAFGPGIGLALRSRSRPFDPASLFQGCGGVFYDVRPENVTRDMAGTVPAGVGDTIGRLFDRSGNGNDAVQASAAARPILGEENGRYFLDFDGIDDKLSVAFSLAQPVVRISALRQLSWTSGDPIFGGYAGTFNMLVQTAPSPGLRINSGPSSGDAPIGVNAVVSEHFEGANSRIAINGGAAAIGDAAILASDGLSLGARHATIFAHVRLFGVVMIGRALSSAETAQLQAWAASKAGVSL